MTDSQKPDNKISPASQIQMLDSEQSTQELLHQYQAELAAIDKAENPRQWAEKALDVAEALLSQQQQQEAWQQARPLLDIFLQHKQWQEAVETCNVLFQTEQDDSIIALGHGVWLGVSFPIAAETTVAMLHHIVDETPPQADGAAIAAAVAKYIVELRTEGEKQESLLFLTGHILGQVAQRHSGVSDQASFDAWLTHLQLNDPAAFLPKLAQVLDAMVGQNWWFDRDRLREELPND